MTWERADTPGFPEGAMRKLLKIDQETGIGAALRWHPEGYTEPRHYHTTAAHSIYVLEGRLDVGGVEAGPGHFFARIRAWKRSDVDPSSRPVTA